MNMKRSVVTGMGCISPLGESVGSIKAQGNRQIKDCITNKYGDIPVGLVPDKYFEANFEARDKSRFDRVSMLVSSVVGQCIESSGIKDQPLELDNTGIMSGSLFGSIDSDDSFRKSLYDDGPAMLDPMKFPLMSHNYPVSVSAIKYGLKGPITAFVSSISSSLNALGFAHYLIKKGQTKRMIVIGCDEITALGYSLLGKLGYMVNGKNSYDHTGLSEAAIPCEGCTGIVIEERETARRRGADIFGELLGWQASYGSYETVQDSRIQNNIAKTLNQSPMDKKGADLLLLNQSGVQHDDDAEFSAVQKLENQGYSFGHTLGLKSVIGNYLGASGITEMAVALNMFNDDIGEGHNAIKAKKVDSILINNFGLGGNIISFILRKHDL